ncbi:MAG: amino acid ABC transporter ATP-binding protein [Azospirillaceae bacterium]
MSALLEVRDLHKRFGDVTVLDGVDLDVEAREVVAIIGSSGSGKTTFLRCINLLEEFDAGEVRIDGEAIGYRMRGDRRVREPERVIARQRAMTGMAFQHFNLFPHLTAARNVMLGLTKVRGMHKAEARAEAEKWLARVGLADRCDSYPSQLSGGQQQRVAIARAIAMNPKLMLFDEVTSALDPELVAEVLATIKDLADEGMTMLIVTHEMRFARDVADRIVFMNEGRVAEQGPPAELLANPKTQRLQEFLQGTAL